MLSLSRVFRRSVSLYASVNPTTGKVIKEFPQLENAQVEEVLSKAQSAFKKHRHSTFQSRAERLEQVGNDLENNAVEYAKLITLEMGKPRTAAEAEVKKCASVCRYYAQSAEKFLQPHEVATDASRSYVTYQPLGAILAVMPWNFPFWQVLRFAAPLVMAGNVGILKHAPNVPQCALALENVFAKAGLGDGIFQNVFATNEQVETMLADPRVCAVTLTGSNRAGSAVAASAGRHVKKSCLELGGSDAFIVLADADLDAAAAAAATSRFANSGQVCVAAKRILVEKSVAAQFTDKFLAAVGSLTVGDPSDAAVTMGPMARSDLRDQLHDQVKRTVAAGAKVLVGGKAMNREGYFYEPTVLTDVRPGMAAFDEETFGPLAPLITVDSADEAVEFANASAFGLGATVFTKDLAKGEKIALGIESGMVYVNTMLRSDPRLPFGGVKNSGYGRECSEAGLKEFVNTKVVWLQ